MAEPTPAPARSLGSLTRLVDATAGPAAAVTFGALSAVRRARIFHPTGAAFEATLDVSGTAGTGAPLLDGAGRHRCVVRLSRGAGLPEPLPDIFGLALRVLDAHGPGRHQDLLVNTAGRPPVLRSVFVPALGHGDGHYSSVLPYKIGGSVVVLGATPVLRPGIPSPRRFRTLATAANRGELRYTLEVAPVAGQWRPVGTIEIGRRFGDREAEALRFNPMHTGGGIEPFGFFQTLRRLAYAGSQATRPTGGYE